MNRVRLSVITLNYNHGRFLKKRISEILEQLGPQDEYILLDDASTDDSFSLMEKFAAEDPRIRLLRNATNQGVVVSANRALDACRGDYFIFLSADDALLPGFIEETMAVLEAHPEMPLCCSDCAMSFEGHPDKDPSQIYTTHLIPDVKETKIFSPQEIVKVFRTTPFWIPGHTAILKREVFLSHGGFDPSLGPSCDWFGLHQIALLHGAAYIPKSLSVWRQEAKSYSKALDKQQAKKMHQAVIRAIGKTAAVRRLFLRSYVAYVPTRWNLFWLLARPWYWDFLFFFTERYLRKKLCFKTVSKA